MDRKAGKRYILKSYVALSMYLWLITPLLTASRILWTTLLGSTDRIARACVVSGVRWGGSALVACGGFDLGRTGLLDGCIMGPTATPCMHGMTGVSLLGRK